MIPYRVLSVGMTHYFPQGNQEHCHHTPHEYMGSFHIETNGRSEFYDVYLTSRYPSVEGMSTCLRYGNDGPEYLTPGHPHNMVQFAEKLPAYAESLKLILGKCCAAFLKHPQEPS